MRLALVGQKSAPLGLVNLVNRDLGGPDSLLLGFG
jgi:hypothetical protein